MRELTEEIVAGAARDVIGSLKIRFGEREIDYTPPWPRRKYADLFAEHVGLAIDDIDGIRKRARTNRSERVKELLRIREALGQPADEAYKRKLQEADTASVDTAVLTNELFEHYVEKTLINPTFVIDYPAPLCPLTRRAADPNFALRFEPYINGMEIGNAYSELNDPAVQRANLAGQLAGEGDETMRVMDTDFVEALEYGMPPAGGLGIGVDRLMMLLTNSPSIRDVILFPLQRPQATCGENLEEQQAATEQP
jgi:lysyl-tRNA synthetase class 2